MTVRALLIDDDLKLHELLATWLRPHEVVLAHAPDGPRGLAAVAAGGVDLIVLDVMMPGMDGLEVLRRLRQRSALPVIMLTARGDETDRVVLMICDPRLISKAYGKRIWRSLPPMTRTRDLADVVAFFSREPVTPEAVA